MKFFSPNLADTATLTESTQNTYFPVENIQDYDKDKAWKTLGTQATESIVFDLGSAQTVNSVIVYNHNFTGTETDIKIQGNDADSWATPAVDETLTYVATTFGKSFTGGAYRYWRLVFTKANASDIRSIGRVFLGASVSVDPPDHAGIGWTIKNNADVSRSIGGKVFASDRNTENDFSIPFTNLPETSMTLIRTVYTDVGSNTPLWFQIDVNSPLADYRYAYFSDRPLEPRIGGYGSEYYWNVTLDFVEAL